MSDEGRAPYVVEVESEGCERCCAGRMWTVVGPDDVALSTSFADQEHVEWIAEQMNHAYRAGQSAARADGEAAGLEKAAKVVKTHEVLHGDQRLRQVEGLLCETQHHLGLIEPHTHRGMTDGSTPLWLRVSNMANALERLTAERDRLKAALEQAHRVIEQCDGLIDCDEHPALSAEIAAILAPCDDTGQCPTVPAALRGEGREGGE